jgi:hypothetical protein
MGAGALVAAGGQIASGISAGRAAEKQAKAQKKAMNRYAKALKSQASKLQGGMSAARKRSLVTEAALDRAALGQQARDEAKRGGQNPSAMLEAELDASLQASLAEQQKSIDALSQQEAQAKAAQREALRSQALQTKMQAQAINPQAMKQAASAGMYGQVGSTVGSAAMQASLPVVQQQVAGITGNTVMSRNEDFTTALKSAKTVEELSPQNQLMYQRVQEIFGAPTAYSRTTGR